MHDYAHAVRGLIARLPDLGLWADDLIATAQRHSALPAVADTGGCLALAPTGEVVMWTWKAPSSVEAVTDQQLAHAAIFQAAKKYSELEPFLPLRGPDAMDCPCCGGTGLVRGLPEDLAKSVVCSCGGSGWLPPGVEVL